MAILLAISGPSMMLLYSSDELVNPAITVKVIGHQWYWTYESSDSTQFADVSYLMAPEDLTLKDLCTCFSFFSLYDSCGTPSRCSSCTDERVDHYSMMKASFILDAYTFFRGFSRLEQMTDMDVFECFYSSAMLRFPPENWFEYVVSLICEPFLDRLQSVNTSNEQQLTDQYIINYFFDSL